MAMGKVSKGIKCSIVGCGRDAVRSLPTEKVVAVGLKISETRHAYLCRDHYKEYKKVTRKDRMLDRWRHRA